MEPIDFYFDYVSPYAYLAWTQIRDLMAPHGRDVLPVPVLFAGLLNAHGTRGPAEVPAKRAYIIKDSLRKSAMLGVPFQPPPSHPFNPLLALRVTCAEPTTRLVDALFRAVWSTGAGAETPEQVAAAIRDAGLSPDDLLARAATPAVKDQLRANTDRAIALGVFGVPTMLVDGDLYWGVDSLLHLDRYLSGAPPLDPSIIDRWTSLVASATRSR